MSRNSIPPKWQFSWELWSFEHCNLVVVHAFPTFVRQALSYTSVWWSVIYVGYWYTPVRISMDWFTGSSTANQASYLKSSSPFRFSDFRLKEYREAWLCAMVKLRGVHGWGIFMVIPPMEYELTTGTRHLWVEAFLGLPIIIPPNHPYFTRINHYIYIIISLDVHTSCEAGNKCFCCSMK